MERALDQWNQAVEPGTGGTDLGSLAPKRVSVPGFDPPSSTLPPHIDFG